MHKSLFVLFGLALVACQAGLSDAQVLEKIMGNSNENELQRVENTPGVRKSSNGVMTVNVPIFYDMIKQGSSLGINVLSGLVRVDRGKEAERSGLQGPRPLSVRIFGIPVYERGTRVRPLEPSNDEGVVVTNDRPTSKDGEDEELPIET